MRGNKRRGWKEGRETPLSLLTLLANESLHNIGKIDHPILPFFVLKMCSSEHDMAILPGTAINNFSQLNLD